MSKQTRSLFVVEANLCVRPGRHRSTPAHGLDWSEWVSKQCEPGDTLSPWRWGCWRARLISCRCVA